LMDFFQRLVIITYFLLSHTLELANLNNSFFDSRRIYESYHCPSLCLVSRLNKYSEFCP
jgi:hypothetical protein